MRYVVRAVLGGFLLVPFVVEGGTLGQFLVSCALAIGAGACMPDDWLD